MNRRKLLLGLLLLALVGVLFFAGGPTGLLGAMHIPASTQQEDTGASTSSWGFGRETYRIEGAHRDGAHARDRNAYRQ